ncbi:hypothetical protein H0A36_17400 [Endozoicomonas sp. SM1973]|uniref:Uncharacterized protein n=1 Tax=Spartinivicinus marinus TaxID=2994442 RepID=A0A853I7V5_9GAMM|nr:hypothetical protein [Spartinivicinus marinus]MCX4030149.1 hypothetical protein [Spartinivicinus marinus]NYZ67792.1 hypothetical protein [Spartinivicinus marinus]
MEKILKQTMIFLGYISIAFAGFAYGVIIIPEMYESRPWLSNEEILLIGAKWIFAAGLAIFLLPKIATYICKNVGT